MTMLTPRTRETPITRNGDRPVDATTRRAEHIRETTGCSWESAQARAELERALTPTTNRS